MRTKKVLAAVLAGVMSMVLLAGCGEKTKNTASNANNGGAEASKTEEYPKGNLDFVAPGGAGGGWDMTIRTTAKVLKDTGLVSASMPVTNSPGGGGAVFLSELQTKSGEDDTVVVYSSPLLLVNLNGSSEYSYQDTTPLARLITDYGAFVVAKDSKYTSIKEVMDALKEDPKSVKIGGASSVGSMDHIQFLLMAKAAGVKDIKDIDYVSFQDGTANAQVLGGHVDLLTTGLGDVSALLESGNLKCLATTASERVGEGVLAEIPTCKEEGIDATFENWRGLFGPKDMPEYAVKYWEETLGKMVKTDEWLKASAQNGWSQCYLNSADFTKFLEETNESYKSVLEEIGMFK
ncbi:tripartite tricarboxylate transporter substrate binding protein [Clostridium sediminicola]|uniref:tripartite tricarboxylate transporter substrate binding protein n=1 Tax=Clostridium sediminicola TaxID=3114879 RepID=UPI0031F24C7D